MQASRWQYRQVAQATALVLGAAIQLGCATPQAYGTDPQADYRAAIADAAVASPAKVKDLLPLPPDASVAVVSWVTPQRAPCAPGPAPCALTLGADRLWVTLAGEVQTLCRAWNLRGDPLRRRLEQLLGLPLDPPPQYRKTTFVVMQIARERIERPCLGVNRADPAHPSCTLDYQPDTSAELRNFVGQQMAASYVIDHPKGPGYPYTRLGYTYDWQRAVTAASHYGASEFVVMPHSQIGVTAQIPSDEYCSVAAP